MKLIEELATCDVDDVVPAGEGFRVTMRVLGATTVHVMKMPSAKDTFEFRRGFARVIDLQYGRQEITVNIAPVGAMYKKLLISTEGYVGKCADHPSGGRRPRRYRRHRHGVRGGPRRKFSSGELGEWPENPSFRFLVHWAMRREELCDQNLCPDSPEDGGRCDHCPLDRIDAAQSSERGRGHPLRVGHDVRVEARRADFARRNRRR